MKEIQRFKASLITGNWPNNPEPLVRDDNGDYVKYSDVVEYIESLSVAPKAETIWNEEVENELCSQLIKICDAIGLDADLFDSDHAQMFCMKRWLQLLQIVLSLKLKV